MRLLDQFIVQTGREPESWTNNDIQDYREYLQAHVKELVGVKKYDDMRFIPTDNNQGQC